MSRRNLILKRWTPGAGAVIAIALAGLVLAQGAKEKELYVVTHIDVTPNYAADTAKAVAQFAVDSRKDAGCARFEALRSTDRMNHFELVEVWRTKQDFEAHEAQEHTKRFREKIQPGLGSPFDERLYNVLE
ncbi:MAG TPA: antibiotic biosynthesis monooxygenase [Bryobacteraceae bacterium]|jgi:quinol monooxygenase YgiN